MIDQEYYYEFRPDPQELMLMADYRDGSKHVFEKHKLRASHEIAALILDKATWLPRYSTGPLPSVGRAFTSRKGQEPTSYMIGISLTDLGGWQQQLEVEKSRAATGGYRRALAEAPHGIADARCQEFYE